ncbi:MAG: twin-arginine translocase TatA/TatE family subunit [Nitrososphaeraceae archaeon]
MIGTQEMVIIFTVILLLFGSSKLPELARSMGKATGEFKKAKIESEEEIMEIKNIVSIKEKKL